MIGFEQRIAKLRDLAREKGLSAIVLRRNPNLAWAIGGRVHVPLTLDLACFDLIVTQEGVIAVTNAIEAPRLVAEEFPIGIQVEIINWWESRDAKLPTGPLVGSDQVGAERVEISSEIEKLRQSLVTEDIDRYRVICSDAAIALREALEESIKTDREIDVAGRISRSLWQRDLELVFIGVAGEERAKLMRHPLPTNQVVGPRIVASICARRKGLIASLTRIVLFADSENSSNKSISEYENILQVEAAIFDSTRVGAKFSEPIEAAIAAYPKFGFAPDEWQRHHQGGPTGYAPRDWPANRQSSQVIALDQPIAWNPTGDGWKAEDTILTTANGFEILTNDPGWPMVEVAGRARPALLVRGPR